MNFEPQPVPSIICKLVEFKITEIHIPDTPLFSHPLENSTLKILHSSIFVIAKDKAKRI